MTIRDIAVSFGFDVDQSSISGVEKSINGIKSMAETALGAIGIAFTISGIADLAEAAANAGATASQFTQVFGDMEDQASSSLSKIADDTGIVENRMKASYTQIAAFAKTTGMATADTLGLTDRSMKAVADSAAFYDRSLEGVTDSLQSFLKGNYENDAALGLSCTETTRNAAANALYWKSFKDLAEDQKQLTLLQMVEDANKLSGALGQAARESDTWTNQMGNFQQSITDLKVAVGKNFLDPAVGGLKLLTGIIQSIAKSIPGIVSSFKELGKTMFGVTDGQNNLFRAFKNILASVKVLKPAIDRLMQTLSNGASRSAEFIGGVIDQIGGIENALKLLALVAGAFVISMNWSGIVQGAGKLLGFVSGIGKMFSIANLKTLAFVAAIVLVALIVEDFINFLSGNDSVIGTIFDKAGIGADNAREAIFNAFNKVKKFLSNTWKWIKNTASDIFETLKTVISEHMDSIHDSISKIWEGIKTILSVIWDNISGLAETVFGGLLSFFGGWELDLEGVFDAVISAVDGVLKMFGQVGDWISNHKSVMDSLVTLLGSIAAAFGIVKGAIAAYNIIAGICSTVSAVLTGGFGALSAAGGVLAGVIAFITSPVTIVIAAIAALIFAGVTLYKNWETIKEIATAVWNAISSFIQTVLSGIAAFFTGIWNGIVAFLSGIWSSITETVSSAINGISTTISSALTAIQEFFTNIFTSVGTFVSDTFNNMLTGVSSTVGNIKDAIVNGFTTAVDYIKGLPSQALQWGSDIVSGIADGIKGAVGKVTDAVTGVANKIKSFLHFSVPDEGPLTEYESWMPDFMAGLGKGIEGSEHLVLDRVRNLASGISTLSRAATAKAQTATNSSIRNSSTSVVQNNNFNNSYLGGDMQTQSNVSKAMNRSTNDATSQLAKGLAYAR